MPGLVTALLLASQGVACFHLGFDLHSGCGVSGLRHIGERENLRSCFERDMRRIGEDGDAPPATSAGRVSHLKPPLNLLVRFTDGWFLVEVRANSFHPVVARMNLLSLHRHGAGSGKKACTIRDVI